MKLSVVIVNYNVKHFLQQCLLSVIKAMENMEGEIFVVDNNSVDGSVEMVLERFPQVQVIANKVNMGFAKANNQAIRKSKGEYVLLLNPDTVVEDNTFSKIIEFMDRHPDAGGLGVKMVDGAGKFLPESKRGLPTPLTAFYKIFGLSSLFPHSRHFSKYHLGFLDENEIHKVDVLAGAFMLLRKSVLDITGLLDEAFFMYGEDIDLSYRITQAGYNNYYFPETRIIHYKGESTKKSSVNYVLVFYRAMVVFARKHFTTKRAGVFAFFINIAIYFRAFLAIFSRFFRKIILPLLDMLFLFLGVFLVKLFWEKNIIYLHGGHYPPFFTEFVLPSYVLFWLAAIYFSGGYDKPVRIRALITGVLTGTAFILILYALMPENLRFSRGQILADTIWALVSLSLLRLLLHALRLPGFRIGKPANKRFLIIGDEEEARRVRSIIEESYVTPGFVGLISPEGKIEKPQDFLGTIQQVKDIIPIFSVDVVIFCAKNLSHQTIIDKMTIWKSEHVDFKIAPEDSLSIIGSNSINTSGELYTVDINSIDKPANRRSKRTLDILSSLLFLLLSPLLLFIVKDTIGFLKNIFLVLAGSKTWVGYAETADTSLHLPEIRSGVISVADSMKNVVRDDETLQKFNVLYARDYSIQKDVNLILSAFQKLGR